MDTYSGAERFHAPTLCRNWKAWSAPGWAPVIPGGVRKLLVWDCGTKIG